MSNPAPQAGHSALDHAPLPSFSAMIGLPLAGVLGPETAGAARLLRRVADALPSPGPGFRDDAMTALGPRGLLWSPAVAKPDGGQSFLFLGRLDNRDEVAAALDAPLSLGDRQLAALAWRRWGDKAAARLIGAFVIVAWDTSCEELVLAADPMGCETLFTASGPDWFAFAGHPLALVGCPGIGGKPDMEHFCFWMLNHRSRHDRSLFAGIGRVPPGHTLRVRRDGKRCDAFWRPGRAPPIRFRHDEDYVLAMREMLDRVVAPHIPAEGGVVADLSGGLDSAAVVATAARLAPQCRITTVTTVAEPGAPYPAALSLRGDGDWQGACRVAALYPNITPHRVEAEGLDPFEIDPTPDFADLCYPVLSRDLLGWWGSKYRALQAMAPGRLLSGDGGNFTFSPTGYGLFSDLAASGHWLDLIRQARAAARVGERPVLPILLYHSLRPNIPVGVRRWGRWLRGKTAPAWQDWIPLRPAAANRFGLIDDITRRGRLRPNELIGSSLDQSRDQIEGYIGKNHWRTWRHRRLGIDVRAPLMDPRMVDFALALPQDQFLRGGTDRLLARRSLEDRVPSSVAWDPRRHRQCAEWLFRMTRSRPYWMADLERMADSPLARDVLDLPRLRGLAEAWPTLDQARDQVSVHREILQPGIAGGQFLMWMERTFGA
ncbi:putative Asparagine synthase (Glutamine-hydrolyzing) [Candidatus Terasakiella magnetica]|nr:putative Asparagine synthase (Glutamine-hydrolyzing) [Candidatus Terasakiella magnetica]